MDGGRKKMEFENSCCVVIIPRTKKYYNKNAVCGDWHKIRQNCKLKNVVHVIWKKSLQLFFIWCILRSR